MLLPAERPRAIPNTDPLPGFAPVAEPDLASERTIPDTIPPPAPAVKRDFTDTLQGDAFADRLRASDPSAPDAARSDGSPKAEEDSP